jgi:cephalosporin hydroxylase
MSRLIGPEKMVKIANKRENIEAMMKDQDSQRLIDSYFKNARKYQYVYNFTWLGRPIIQHPADIIALQEIVYQLKPQLIIETGIAHGGSLVFYASILELLGEDGQVLGIDIDIREHNRKEIEKHPLMKRIIMIEGSSIAESTVEKTRQISKGKNPVMVILDSHHSHDHVFNELLLYSPLVTKDSYLVVLDSRIEDMPAEMFEGKPWGKGNNPKTAVWNFLKTTDRFIVDKDIENRILITGAPDGYLKCIRN